MNVILKIDGRKALAVWTLPFVVGRKMFGHEQMLQRLYDGLLGFPKAFILDRHGDIHYLPQIQWLEPLRLISEISREINKKELLLYADRKSWGTKSVELFWEYESCYVWQDEFIRWYSKKYLPSLSNLEDYEDSSLCFCPNLPKTCADYFENHEKVKLRINDCPVEQQAGAIGDNNASKSKPHSAKEVFECLKLMVIDQNKLETLLFKNASKTKWLSDCKLGNGYNLPMVIKAHSKKGLLKEEYQKRFSENELENTLSVNRP